MKFHTCFWSMSKIKAKHLRLPFWSYNQDTCLKPKSQLLLCQCHVYVLVIMQCFSLKKRRKKKKKEKVYKKKCIIWNSTLVGHTSVSLPASQIHQSVQQRKFQSDTIVSKRTLSNLSKPHLFNSQINERLREQRIKDMTQQSGKSNGPCVQHLHSLHTQRMLTSDWLRWTSSYTMWQSNIVSRELIQQNESKGQCH